MTEQQKIVTLATGKKVTVKIPPYDLETLLEMQRMGAREALVNPQDLAFLSLKEISELFVLAAKIQEEYSRGLMQKTQQASPEASR